MQKKVTSPEKLVETILDSGIRVHIRTLSPYDRAALRQAAETKYALPDKREYELEPAEGIAIDGFKIPAEENEEYRQAVEEVEAKRTDFLMEAMLDMCVTFPDFDLGKQGIIAHFADYIATRRKYMTLPEDAWEATWKHAVLRTASDESYIAQIVRDELPLKEVEVSEAIRLFRPAVSREATRLLAYTRFAASRLPSKVQNQP